MAVVLMEHNWNVFQGMGGQHRVLLMAPAQNRNPICPLSLGDSSSRKATWGHLGHVGHMGSAVTCRG